MWSSCRRGCQTWDRQNEEEIRSANPSTESSRRQISTAICRYCRGQRRSTNAQPTRTYYLRWRILLRIFRFLRPSFRRPLPVFFTPIRRRLPTGFVDKQPKVEAETITGDRISFKQEPGKQDNSCFFGGGSRRSAPIQTDPLPVFQARYCLAPIR